MAPGFTNNLKDGKVTSKVLEFKSVKPTDEIAELLSSEEIYVVKRIRYIDGTIFCLEEAYYDKNVVPYLTRDIVEGSIYEYLTKALNLHIGFSDKYMHVEKLNEDISKLLELIPGDPALIDN